MSDKMYDTRKLYSDNGVSDAPNNSHQIVVDKQEWEAMKRAANRAEAKGARSSRIVAAFTPIKHGVAAIANVPVNIALGLWCVVWGAVKCVFYACKYALLGSSTIAFVALFAPTMIRASSDRCEMQCKIGKESVCGKHLSLGLCSFYWVAALFVGGALTYFGVISVSSRHGHSILLITATNILSLLYEIGRAKRNKGKVDVATTTPTMQTIVATATAPEAQPATPPTPKPKVSDRIAKLTAQATTETLPLTLGNASLAQLVQEGNYNYANPSITDANFPTLASGQGQTEAILLGFSDVVTADEVEAVAEAMNLRLGTAKDGAHLGVQHPDRQRTNWLICLGDSWQDSGGDPDVVVLCDDAGDRKLSLGYRGGRWDSSFRFLAFRK